MKKLFVTTLCIAAFGLTSLQLSSCKDKPKDPEPTTVAPTETPMAPSVPVPVVISADDSLTTMLKDATRDYPTVNSSVSNGEVTLTGTLSKQKLPKLMQAVNALHPKKVNQKLTIVK